MTVPIHYFKDFKPTQPRVAKESSRQFFPIDLFVKQPYRVVNIYTNTTSCVGMIVYWSKKFLSYLLRRILPL